MTDRDIVFQWIIILFCGTILALSIYCLTKSTLFEHVNESFLKCKYGVAFFRNASHMGALGGFGVGSYCLPDPDSNSAINNDQYKLPITPDDKGCPVITCDTTTGIGCSDTIPENTTWSLCDHDSESYCVTTEPNYANCPKNKIVWGRCLTDYCTDPTKNEAAKVMPDMSECIADYYASKINIV